MVYLLFSDLYFTSMRQMNDDDDMDRIEIKERNGGDGSSDDDGDDDDGYCNEVVCSSTMFTIDGPKHQMGGCGYPRKHACGVCVDVDDDEGRGGTRSNKGIDKLFMWILGGAVIKRWHWLNQNLYDWIFGTCS